ncbi:hypothetical protein [Ruminococcus sp. Marseille-P6503]|uniref:hypothetical protein n=1 Tax=Ruminococcus sp. Marseille-P6503 TaxID=2364796 RepID=UPI000F535E73|nr:hypothetical protein [Ruminococcus sp. Marseille-P6503]
MSYIILTVILSVIFLAALAAMYDSVRVIAEADAEKRHEKTEQKLRRENMALRYVLDNRHTVLNFEVKGGLDNDNRRDSKEKKT